MLSTNSICRHGGPDRLLSALGRQVAAIVHLHARDPKDGCRLRRSSCFLRVIKQTSNVVVNLTTGWLALTTVETGSGLETGDRKPEHGIDELRTISDAQALQDLQACTGSPPCWKARAISFSANSFKEPGHALERAQQHRRALRVRAPRHEPSLQSALFLDRRPGEGPAVLIQTVFRLLGGIGPHPE